MFKNNLKNWLCTMVSQKTSRKNEIHLSIKCILLFRLFFGLYYKFTSSIIISSLAKLLCLVTGIFHIVNYCVFIRSYYTEEFIEIYSIFELVETFANVLMSLLTEEKYLIQFSINLYTDCLQGVKSTHKNFATYSLIILVLLGEVVTICVSGVAYIDILDYIAFSYRYMACYTSRLTSVLISDGYRSTISLLRNTLTVKWKNQNLDENDKIVDVENFISAYMKLTNNLESTVTITRIKIIFGFVCDVLRVVLLVNDLITTNISWEFIPRCIDTFTFLSILCLPALLMEVAANDLDEIKRMMSEQLLIYKNKKLRSVIYDALDYIAYSSTYTIWNEFPFNINLVMGFLNFCISYIIVLLQFTY